MNKSMPYEGNPESTTGVRHHRVSAEQANQRIDNFLLRFLKGVPRSRIYRLLRRGELRVNGRRARPEYRLAEGDELRIPPLRLAGAAQVRQVPTRLIEALRRSIVYEDADVLVINKPSRVATHGGSGIDFGVIEALRTYWAQRAPHETLELVHRLDRDTSGCLLIARRRARLRELHALLREGQVEKCYLALVSGHWGRGRQVIDAPLLTRQMQGGERVVKVRAQGKAAVSVFRPVQFFGRQATLMEVELKTGRTHQIRVHAAHAGHPLAGDDKYGERTFNDQMRARGLTRLFLHAQMVSFTWPNGRPFSVSVPLDEELKAVLDRLA